MARAGVTLVELLVVLVLLGLVFGISGLALASLSAPRISERLRVLDAARAKAMQTGVAVVVVDSGGPVLLLPDGRGLGATVDPLTGAPRATR